MRRGDMVEEVGASALPGLSTADRLMISSRVRGCIRVRQGCELSTAVLPPASDLEIAVFIAEEVPVDIYEMEVQRRIVSVEEKDRGTCIDLARHGRGGEEKGRYARVNREEVMEIGVMCRVSGNDDIAPIETAEDEWRGG
jgi:hypothetical protein